MELPNKIFHKPAVMLCRDKAGDAENGLLSANRPLLVRSIDAGSRAREDLCERVAGARDSPRDEGHSPLSRHCLLCLAPVMRQRLFCGSQHQIVSYDNDFTVKWRRGFDWKQRS